MDIKNTRVCSQGDKKIYTNTPKWDTIHIIHTTLSNNSDINQNIIGEIINISQVALEQNYIQFIQSIFIWKNWEKSWKLQLV
jgi:hypothetical protein